MSADIFQTPEDKIQILRVDNWEKLSPKNLLIYGESKSGKTYLALSIIKKHLEENPDSKLYVINTDMGFTHPAKQLGLEKFADRIELYYVKGIKDTIHLINMLKKTVKANDFVLFDLVSWIWDEAQKEFVQQLGGDDVVNFISRAMNSKKSFGLFEGMQWGYVKKLDDMVSSFLVKNPVCNVIAIARVKDSSFDQVFNKQVKTIYDKVGKPDGRKDLMYEFNTIIRLIKNETTGKRSIIITGTRNKELTQFTPIEFTNFEEVYPKIKEVL